MWRHTTFLIIHLLVLWCVPTILFAQVSADDPPTDDGLDEILQGFDEEGLDDESAIGEKDQSLDDVLEGFDEGEEVRKEEAFWLP